MAMPGVTDSVNTAILLAAGRGSRLAPFTDSTPKPLLALRGRPTLDYLLSSIRAAGIQKVALVTHHLAEQIEAYAKEVASQGDLEIRCTRQHKMSGTADALQCAAEQLPEDWLDASFLLSATDYIVPRNFITNLVDFHQSHRAHISVSLKQLADEQSMRSSVRFDEQKQITEIVEKPAPGTAPSSFTANLTFILPSSLLPLLATVPPSIRGEREVQSAINEFLAKQGTAMGLLQPTPAEWQHKLVQSQPVGS